MFFSVAVSSNRPRVTTGRKCLFTSLLLQKLHIGQVLVAACRGLTGLALCVGVCSCTAAGDHAIHVQHGACEPKGFSIHDAPGLMILFRHMLLNPAILRDNKLNSIQFLYLVHTEYQNTHSTSKVRTFLGSGDIVAGSHTLQAGLGFLGSGVNWDG